MGMVAGFRWGAASVLRKLGFKSVVLGIDPLDGLRLKTIGERIAYLDGKPLSLGAGAVKGRGQQPITPDLAKLRETVAASSNEEPILSCDIVRNGGLRSVLQNLIEQGALEEIGRREEGGITVTGPAVVVHFKSIDPQRVSATMQYRSGIDGRIIKYRKPWVIDFRTDLPEILGDLPVNRLNLGELMFAVTTATADLANFKKRQQDQDKATRPDGVPHKAGPDAANTL